MNWHGFIGIYGLIASLTAMWLFCYGWLDWVDRSNFGLWRQRRRIMALATLLFPITIVLSVPIAAYKLLCFLWWLILVAVGREP